MAGGCRAPGKASCCACQVALNTITVARLIRKVLILRLVFIRRPTDWEYSAGPKGVKPSAALPSLPSERLRLIDAARAGEVSERSNTYRYTCSWIIPPCHGLAEKGYEDHQFGRARREDAVPSDSSPGSFGR